MRKACGCKNPSKASRSVFPRQASPRPAATGQAPGSFPSPRLGRPRLQPLRLSGAVLLRSCSSRLAAGPPAEPTEEGPVRRAGSSLFWRRTPGPASPPPPSQLPPPPRSALQLPGSGCHRAEQLSACAGGSPGLRRRHFYCSDAERDAERVGAANPLPSVAQTLPEPLPLWMIGRIWCTRRSWQSRPSDTTVSRGGVGGLEASDPPPPPPPTEAGDRRQNGGRAAEPGSGRGSGSRTWPRGPPRRRESPGPGT